MIKLTGIFLLLIAGALLGFSASRQVKRRTDALQLCLDSVEAIEQEIRYSGRLTGEIVERLAAEEVYRPLDFYQKMAQHSLETGFFDPGAASRSVRDYGKHMRFTEEELDALARFFQELGSSDAEGQCSLCESTESKLRQLLEKRRREEQPKRKLYGAAGILGALFLAILMI